MQTRTIPRHVPYSARFGSRLLDDLLVGLNVAAAIFFGGLFYALRDWTSVTPPDDFAYLCLRNMYRVIDFLGLGSQGAVIVTTVQRQFPTRSEQFGAEVFVMVTWLGIAGAAILVLAALRRLSIYNTIRPQSVRIILLLASPGCFVSAALLTRKWPAWPEAAGFSPWKLALPVFPVEVVLLGLLFLVNKRRHVPIFVSVLAISVHFVFWTIALWSATRNLFFPMYSRDLILLVLPASMLVSVLHAEKTADSTLIGRRAKWTLVLAVVALLPFAFVWAPARDIKLSGHDNLASTVIELSRGPCFGSCAVYTVTVYGDGRVEYVGWPVHSRVQTKKSGIIGTQRIRQILQLLDKVRFTTLEGRAFIWSFDTPSVGVRASVGRKTKQVVSDSYTVGAPMGRQAQFVRATLEIDEILASTTWTKCDGECQNAASDR